MVGVVCIPVAPGGDAHGLDDEDDHLAEEDEKEEEEADGAVGPETEDQEIKSEVFPFDAPDGFGAAFSLEGLVDGPVPAEEGAGAEEDEPKDGQAKVHTLTGIFDEVGQTGQKVDEQRHTVHCKPQEKVVSTGRSNHDLQPAPAALPSRGTHSSTGSTSSCRPSGTAEESPPRSPGRSRV